jgi:hypothetical integral membrane protein (TIGR02206 family)
VSHTGQYYLAVSILAAAAVAALIWARRAPRPAVWVGWVLAVALLVDAVVFVVSPATDGSWTARSSLPLNLCDVALVIAALACWWPAWQLGVELTYFWGLAGTLQAILTPDLSAGARQLTFWEFVVAHVGIVTAAGYLVWSLRRYPRPHAVPRIFAITLGYSAIVALADWATGGNYMYLARLPAHVSLLSALGPWPWYIAGAAAVGLAMFVALDLPFRHRAEPSPPRRLQRPDHPRERVQSKP